MKIQYFKGTDTLYIQLRPAKVNETRDLDEDTLIDLDEKGSVVALTIAHASDRTDTPKVSFEEVAGL